MIQLHSSACFPLCSFTHIKIHYNVFILFAFTSPICSHKITSSAFLCYDLPLFSFILKTFFGSVLLTNSLNFYLQKCLYFTFDFESGIQVCLWFHSAFHCLQTFITSGGKSVSVCTFLPYIQCVVVLQMHLRFSLYLWLEVIWIWCAQVHYLSFCWHLS